MVRRNRDQSPLDIKAEYAKKGTLAGYVRGDRIAGEPAVFLATSSLRPFKNPLLIQLIRERTKRANNYWSESMWGKLESTEITVVFRGNREDLCVDEVQSLGLSRQLPNILTQC